MRHTAAIAGWLVCCLVVLGGCYRNARDGQFRDQQVVWRVNDRHPIPEPAERSFYALSYLSDVLVFDPIVEALDRPRRPPAGNTNALDEVPDSTWFTNRIGRRTVSPKEAARGADVLGPPVPPYTVIKAKGGGANPGFLIQDAREVRYLVKFDTVDNPEQQTATNAIVNRVFWTLGYNVPADFVFFFQRGQLGISDKARSKYGLDEETIDTMLQAAVRRADGAYRATASQFLDGIPKGGWAPTGVRPDDANDRVAHEHRRELRGLRVFAAWLGHTDMKEDNTVDMFVSEPDGGDGARGYLVHYFVDFGEALGGHQSEKNQLMIGWEYGWDWKNQGKALFSFGLWRRAWECQQETPWKSIGYYGATHFDPRQWRERYPYAPFQYMDRADAYWAAKLVMRFDRDLLTAIVAEGQFSDPEAAAYLVDTLLARRAKIGAVYLDGVTPLDDFQVQASQLCATDLSHKYGVAEPGTVEWLDPGLPVARKPVGASARVCLPLSNSPGYRVARVRVNRGSHRTPVMQVHYVGGESPRIVGIVR